LGSPPLLSPPLSSLFFSPPLPPFSSYVFPSLFSLPLPAASTSLRSRYPLFQLGSLESTVSSQRRLAEPQPKSILMHFSLKIWHLLATVLMIFLRINYQNFILSLSDYVKWFVNIHRRSRSRWGKFATGWCGSWAICAVLPLISLAYAAWAVRENTTDRIFSCHLLLGMCASVQYIQSSWCAMCC